MTASDWRRGVVCIEGTWLHKSDVADLLNEVRSLRKLDDAIFAQIAAEMDAQDRQWGIQNHDPFRWLAILGEEKGEACKAANEGQWDEYEAELIQVAAVAVNAVECSRRDRNAEAGGE